MCPFFIVSDVEQSVRFYEERLGFGCWHKAPEEGSFFAIAGRDGAMLLLKAGVAGPLPNRVRDPEMRWDAYVTVQEVDELAAEFAGRGVTFSKGLRDTEDGLRGFEVTDPDGYVLFFGRQR
jgi:catechol 2,3-dioxygenase-like lactoylglutathione lyase family enzyme